MWGGHSASNDEPEGQGGRKGCPAAHKASSSVVLEDTKGLTSNDALSQAIRGKMRATSAQPPGAYSSALFEQPRARRNDPGEQLRRPKARRWR